MLTLTSVLKIIAQILNAGVAITAIALAMYALSFNFRDIIARTFMIILALVAIVFFSDTIANISNSPAFIQTWLQLRWAAMAFLPAAYFYFSDALLTITGRPSRGRRTLLVRIFMLISLVWAVLIPLHITVGELAAQANPVAYLQTGPVSAAFGVYYLGVLALSFYNLARAVMRSNTTTTRRRLFYLFIGASAPAVTCVLYLFHGSALFARNPDFFWLLTILGATLTGISLVVIAYVVSFFGLNWTDRAIKSRLFRWLMRGPFVAMVVLGATTVVRRYGLTLGDPYIAYVPVVMVGTILVLEYFITLLAPGLEKTLFFGADREDLSLIRTLEERMLTEKDLDQFLEIIAASICDQLQVRGAFIAVVENGSVNYIITAGDRHVMDKLPESSEIIRAVQADMQNSREMISLGQFKLIPLAYQQDIEQIRLFGVCGFPDGAAEAFLPE
ncbi:MAG: histidine kinase N-terminal 7TM domain-containing protein, partial [Anaerolineaceae bacterium]